MSISNSFTYPNGNIKLIVIIPMSGNILLDVAGPIDVFMTAAKMLAQKGINNSYKVLVASPCESTTLTCSSGIEINCTTSAFRINQVIDTLLVVGHNLNEVAHSRYTRFYGWLQSISPAVRRLGSVCIGAFALAEAGLLSDKQVTTHWEYCEQLQHCYPDIKVDPNPFFKKDGSVYTSGGVSSGMDLALALIEEDCGKALAIQVARKLVLYTKRPGSQLQFGALLPGFTLSHTLAGSLRAWIVENLDKELGVAQMAEYLHMSPRNFTRVFSRQTGIAPAKFVEKLRVEVARKYLEDSDHSIEQIALICGLGGLVSMRRIFIRNLALSPSEYRKKFRVSIRQDGMFA